MRTQTDSRGLPIFPDDAPIAIPIGGGVSVAGDHVARPSAFGNVPTAGGTKDLATILNARGRRDRAPTTAPRTAALATALDRHRRRDQPCRRRPRRAGPPRRAVRYRARSPRQFSRSTLEEERGALEGTDITATVARLQAKLITLEAAQAAFARISKQTLFDVLG